LPLLYLIFIKEILRHDISDFDVVEEFFEGVYQGAKTNLVRVIIFLCILYDYDLHMMTGECLGMKLWIWD